MLSALPRLGPTETIIDSELRAFTGGKPSLLSLTGRSQLPGLISRVLGPDGPEDSGKLVGKGGGGAIVASTSLQVERPGSQAVRFARAFRGKQDGSGAVDEQGSKVGIAPLRDGTEVTGASAGELPGDQTEEACEASARWEPRGITHKGEHGGSSEQSDAGDREETLCRGEVLGHRGELAFNLAVRVAIQAERRRWRAASECW
jgi:hypothetical protein